MTGPARRPALRAALGAATARRNVLRAVLGAAGTGLLAGAMTADARHVEFAAVAPHGLRVRTVLPQGLAT
ncbi:hypothetical protein [Streptomyces venetus]|uniref:hypothetical protein n=1 Tax=Streptomyces venetus TaxID=1701086 RepID=UPI003C2CFA9E